MRACVFAIFFLPILSFGQHGSSGHEVNDGKDLHYYFTLYSQADGKLAPSFDPVREFIKRVELRRNSFRDDRALVHHLFFKTHQTFFRKFQATASFSDLITSGTYNCLSGTALYALLLQHFEIDYEIIETNYHIFLLVNTGDGEILLETTDGVNGFVEHPKMIQQKIQEYQSHRAEKTEKASVAYQYEFSMKDTVSLTAMLGLLHYNHAVDAYNNLQYKKAVTHLHHALLLHRSQKLETFLQLLSTTILYDRMLDSNTKDQYLQKLGALQKRKTIAVTHAMIPLIR